MDAPVFVPPVSHSDTLMLTLVGAFVLAFILGMIALRLKLSPLLGYLIAGVVVGPFTPGYVADTSLAPQLAEIGVVLLMFGVGLHFSPADLSRVRKVAIPAAVAQVALLSVVGWGLGRLLGLGDAEAALMGFSLSVASTVVVLRVLEERKAVRTPLGQVAVGWLVAEDLIVIVALVLAPLFLHAAGGGGLAGLVGEIGWTLARIGLFVGLMLVVGGRVLPWLLVRIAHTGSRELFTLGVLSIALGIAYVAFAVFGASFALGAFIAGLVLNGSPLGHSAAERSLPLRDAFAVLFFVSVGMLFDPWVLLKQPLSVAAVLAVVVAVGPIAAYAVTRLLKVERRSALLLAGSLGQIGEFSFVLTGLGVTLQIMSRQTHDLVLAAALISIAVNPFVMKLAERLAGPEPEPEALQPA